MSDLQDLDEILAPISEENPSGEGLRYEGTYDLIKEARREDDDLPSGVWEKSSQKVADWQQVETLCLKALKTRSKDLQIAVWLLEAWGMQYGFAGVRSGLQVLRALCEAFWESLYPELDEDDPEYRLAPLLWMSDKLPGKFKTIPVTQPEAYDLFSYSFLDYETARQLDNMAVKNPELMAEAEAERKVTTPRFNASSLSTPLEFFLTLEQDLTGAIEALGELEGYLDQQCGRDAPSFRVFRETMQAIQKQASDTVRARGGAPIEQSDTAIAEDGSVVQTGSADLGTGGVATGAIRTREDAYRQLSTIADFLQKIEPHSPVPYLLKRAITWGSMPLATLLMELMESGDLQSIYKLLGIKEQTDEEY